jgi:hypothetical protein
MLQALLNMVVGVLGWSPVGRDLLFMDGEGPESEKLRGLRVNVVKVMPSVLGAQSERIYVRLQSPIAMQSGWVEDIVLIPRHRRFDSTALATTSIAVYVCRQEGIGEGLSCSEPVAQMDVRLCK